MAGIASLFFSLFYAVSWRQFRGADSPVWPGETRIEMSGHAAPHLPHRLIATKSATGRSAPYLSRIASRSTGAL
jgi:hypothetical protein